MDPEKMLDTVMDELGFGKERRRERPMAMHIPYMRHVSDTVIRLQNGAIAAVIKLDGLFFQTEDQAELNMRASVRNTMIRALGSSRFSLWSTLLRREVRPELGGTFSDPLCALLDRRYSAELAKKRMFTNELYLTVLRSGMRGALGLSDAVLRLFDRSAGIKMRNEELGERINEFEELLATLTRELARYGARPLGIVHRDGAPYSEPCTFFNTILTCGLTRPLRLPRMAIRDHVGSSRLFFGKRSLQAQGATPDENRFGAILSIKEYPPFSGPGMLDGLLQLDHEFILTQSFTIADRPIAQERIARLKRQIRASDEADSPVEADIDFALDSLVNQEAVFGYYHFSLLCLSRELDGLDKAVAELGACLTDINVNWLREDLNLEAAFWAQLPGNHGYIARTSMLSSANFGGLSSMHNFATGQASGTHWKTPVAILETTSQTPYWFNFHQRDLGHFLVTGPSGSGKTVVLTFLLAQAFRVRPEPRAVFFDKDRGAEIFVRAVGGAYEILEPDVATGFNPLQLQNTPANREFLLRLVKQMLRGSGGFALSAEEEAIVERAIGRICQEPLEQRTLANLAGLLMGRTRASGNDLPSRLRPWFEGERAWVFNAGRDVLSFSGRRLFGFDMTHILDNADVRTPVLMYLFHRLDELLTGEPVMIFMDEGWKLLQDQAFSRYITDKMKTIRKLNGIVGFGTQSAADIAGAPQSHTLIEQAATSLHFPNPRADEESYIGRFGLTAKEFGFIRNTPPESRTFLIKHGIDSVIARLDLSAMPDLLKVLSGRKETVEACAVLRARLGDQPADWLGAFCGWEPS